jgi:shikimate kinase
MKIFLIGMPGSGKSTLGKQLSEKLMTTFVDLDKEIENYEGKSINEIFGQLGEDHFRQSESRLLNQFAVSSESFVMATGGGAPCFYNGIETINASGVSIFLDVPLERLVAHTANRSTRPLLQNDSEIDLFHKLQKIREQRLLIYNKARITVHKFDVESLLKSLAIIQ